MGSIGGWGSLKEIHWRKPSPCSFCALFLMVCCDRNNLYQVLLFGIIWSVPSHLHQDNVWGKLNLSFFNLFCMKLSSQRHRTNKYAVNVRKLDIRRVAIFSSKTIKRKQYVNCWILCIYCEICVPNKSIKHNQERNNLRSKINFQSLSRYSIQEYIWIPNSQLFGSAYLFLKKYELIKPSLWR